MQHINLRQWTLEATSKTDRIPMSAIPAEVPGCVHTDLLRAGLIPDPYPNDNELGQRWIGDIDWLYTCRFEIDRSDLQFDHLQLVCEGLDTIARVSINGEDCGQTDNMHRRWRIECKSCLKQGTNILQIYFNAPTPHTRLEQDRYGKLAVAGGTTGELIAHNYIRKMACNFGWDWGPVLPTCGIWRPIYIEGWSDARLGDVQPRTTLQGPVQNPDRATLTLCMDMETTCEVEVVCELVDPEGITVTSGSVSANAGADRVEYNTLIENPRLWWPVGHGAQPLYTAKIKLVDKDQNEFAAKSVEIGLRTTELDTSADLHSTKNLGEGEAMTLRVNGKAIYCKGANWIPDDCFPSRISELQYRNRIDQALGAGMNMLRIWGGGIYEDDAFYEHCDRTGIMVWQDFLFACALYPEEEPYRSSVEAEVRDNVSRLARHPSLVLYNGGNECIWATYAWADEFREPRKKGDRTWGLGYYLELLPKIINEVDPSRPYWPNSPYSGSMDRHPNLNEFGNRHMWDVWHGDGNYRNYLGHYPRFASEFGYHGPATWATIETYCPTDQMFWNSDIQKLHNKNGRPGQEQTHTRLQDDFDPPVEDFSAWHYLAQVMQARALSMGVEWFRCLSPWNSGVLYWQLNDCYPVSSWSSIDSGGRLKPLWYASRRFNAERLLSIKPVAPVDRGQSIEKLCGYLHNDSDKVWQTTVRLRKYNLLGEVLIEEVIDVSVPERSVFKTNIPTPWLDDRDQTMLAIEAEGLRNFWWFQPDKEMQYPASAFNADLTAVAGGYQLTINAESLIRDLCIFPDRLDPDATISDQFITLLPGDEVVLLIKTSIEMSLNALTAAPVMRSVNAFGKQE